MISNLGLAVEEALINAETKGKLEGKLEVARNMLLDNVQANTISNFTGLPLSEIEDLMKQVKHGREPVDH
ncbi:MAG: hypothetical protein ABSA82_06855 [Thermacetogeniaceae bacterium]|jgi:hypothetical protein